MLKRIFGVSTKLILRVGLSLGAILILLYVWKSIEDHKNPEAEAKAFHTAADECLYDIRDRKKTYETSTNCQSLSSLSLAYETAGGGEPNEPLRSRLEYSQGRTSAWMAKAPNGSSLW